MIHSFIHETQTENFEYNEMFIKHLFMVYVQGRRSLNLYYRGIFFTIVVKTNYLVTLTNLYFNVE